MKKLKTATLVALAVFATVAPLTGCTPEEKADTSKVMPKDKAPGKLDSDSGAGGAGNTAAPPATDQAQTKP
ncbi:MAG: hypothetical protein JSS65_08060 [Armatimonadetes bacterium]|nr:hypothetical protein [Armatimonadota bacterium]